MSTTKISSGWQERVSEGVYHARDRRNQRPKTNAVMAGSRQQEATARPFRFIKILPFQQLITPTLTGNIKSEGET